MNLYSSLTIRYLKENKKRTLVTILGVILSTALICAIGNVYASFMDYNFRETVKKEGSFHATLYDVKKENLKYIYNSSGISDYGFSSNLGFATIGKQRLLQVKKYDKCSFKNFQISLKSGRLPNNQNEIIVSENAFRILNKDGYKLEDEINLDLGKRITLNGDEAEGNWVSENEYINIENSVTYKIVGVMKKPGFEIEDNVTIGISFLDIQQIEHNESVNSSIIVNDPKEVYEISKNIAKNANLELQENEYGNTFYKVSYNVQLLRLLGVSQYKYINKKITMIIIIISLLVVVSTIATVYNSFNISTSERRKQFGILNSIGATNTQLMNIVLTEGIVISVVSIPIGIISGSYAIDIVFRLIKLFFKESFIAQRDLRIVYDLNLIIVSILVILFSIFIAVYLPAKTASKISPLDAIKNYGDKSVTKVRSSKLIKFFLKAEGDIAYKNLRRNKNKFRVCLFSLVISIVIFISFSGFMKIILYVESDKSVKTNYDMNLYSNDEIVTREMQRHLNRIQGINNVNFKYYGKDSYVSMHVHKDKLTKDGLEVVKKELQNGSKTKDIYSLMNNSLHMPGDRAISNLKLESGNFNKEEAIESNGVILSNRAFFETQGKKNVVNMTTYKVGDSIRVYSNSNNDYKYKGIKLKVMAITNDLLLGESTHTDTGISFITYDEVGENLGINVKKHSVLLDTNKEKSTRESIKKVAESYNFKVEDKSNKLESQREDFLVIQIFVYGFILVITLVSITTVVNTISTSINLRKKELSIIKSIGVTSKGLKKMVYLESFLYGLLSLFYGIPISIGLILFFQEMIRDIKTHSLILPWDAIFICIVGIFTITFIASFLPVNKLNKANIIEYIRRESI